MGDEHDGLVQHPLEAQELVLHLPADERVERRERLVEEPDLGLDRERAGDADALLLATRELVREARLAPLEADEIEHLHRPLVTLLTRLPLHLERKGDVFQHRQVGHQPEVLEHHAHLAAANVDELRLRRLEQVRAVEQHLAGGRLDEPRQAAHDRRFARARKPHDDEDLALADVEADVARRRDVAALADALDMPRRIVDRAVRAVEEARGLGAVQLPQVTARQLDLVRVFAWRFRHRSTPGKQRRRGRRAECAAGTSRPVRSTARERGLDHRAPLGLVVVDPFLGHGNQVLAAHVDRRHHRDLVLVGHLVAH